MPDKPDPFDEPFALVLRALPGRGPARHRVKKALKVLLRSFGLRCERVTGPDVELTREEVAEFVNEGSDHD